MKNHDLLFLGILALGVWVWMKRQVVSSTPIAPGSTGAAGGLLTLPPGLPSGQSAINVALGYNPDGSPILNPADANSGVLPSTPLGIGYVDLAPDLQSSLTFDDGLVNDSSDQGDYGMAVLPSTQTVPFVS